MLLCIDCGSAIERVTVERSRLPLAQCQSCDLVQLAEWGAEFDPRLYDYYRDCQGRATNEIYPLLNQGRNKATLEALKPRPGHLLDVGCGVGGFVRSALDLGWRAEGIDLSIQAIEVAQMHDLPCDNVDFFDSRFDDRKYDVIVMTELLEHVPQPTRFLARARQLLGDSGVIYITTPNGNSLSRRLLKGDWRVIHVEHLSYFTPGRLRQSARRSGLSVSEMQTANISPITLKRLLRREPVASVEAARADEQVVRAAIQQSRSKRYIKWAVNQTLRFTGTGDSIRVVLTH